MAAIMPCGLLPQVSLSEEHIKDIFINRYKANSFITDEYGGVSVRIDDSQLFYFFINDANNSVLLLFDLATEKALIDGDAAGISELLHNLESPVQFKINFAEDNRLNIYQITEAEYCQDEILRNTVDNFIAVCRQAGQLFNDNN